MADETGHPEPTEPDLPGAAAPGTPGAPGAAGVPGGAEAAGEAEDDGVARAEELAEVLSVARESGDGSLLMRTLARAAVFVPLPGDLESETGARELEPGTEVPLPVIENEGTRYVVAFTSSQRLLEWFASDTQPVWHESLLPDVLPAWPADTGLALDASSEGGVLLPPAVIERLQALAAGEPLEEAYDLGPATRFRAGAPLESPQEVLDALRAVASEHPGVRAVRLLLVQIDEPGGRTWPVVGVLLDEGADADAPLSAMVEAVEKVTDEHVSFTALPPEGGSEFEQVLRDEGLVVV